MQKLIIYQVFTRTFGNRKQTRQVNGTMSENGVGKMNDFNASVLRQIKNFGATAVWYTGVIRHATCSDYSAFGIPKQSSRIVKGKAGSPYAITDYYDIDPDIAENVTGRMEEFDALVSRTHKAGLKVIIDFVPNHVARQYKSIAKPFGISDLGEDDDTGKHFDAQNNFYYCPNEHLDLSAVAFPDEIDSVPYEEFPAKCTGNDRFDAHPQQNDWYETVKLNYGIDYCDAGGRSYHFSPLPSTWLKMADILFFWASKGIDGFRCDMAEMVPREFWSYITGRIKNFYPHIVFIGEVYEPSKYRDYISAGFDYLYDKGGMYDCIRDVMCGRRPASSITNAWQNTDDIQEHMLYFLENHDEQRIASDFFCGNPQKGIPGMIVSSLLRANPLMVYAGQEFGERGMDREGFSGVDGRSTIFDYWCTDSVFKGYFSRSELTLEQLYLEGVYAKLMNICNEEKAVQFGKTFDLMYANMDNEWFNPDKQFAFMRKDGGEALLIVANFDDKDVDVEVRIPAHAFDYMQLVEGKVMMTDLMTGESLTSVLSKDTTCRIHIKALRGRIYKFMN